MRPVIIFFDKATQLYDFYHCPLFTDAMKGKTLILTEEHEPSIRDNRVFRSTHSGSISLMTKSFGRGTDFQVFDENIQKNGGVHIIVTFLCMEEAD